MLTEQEFQVLQASLALEELHLQESLNLNRLMIQVVKRGNPADPLNTNETFAGLVALYAPVYNAQKAAIETAFNNLPVV
jgi:hypothetical protein